MRESGSRRRFLAYLAAATGLAAAALPFRQSLLAALRLRIIGTNSPLPVAALADGDMETLLALGDVLIPSASATPRTPRAVSWDAPPAAAMATNPLRGGSSDLARAKDAYERSCVPCHGPAGTPLVQQGGPPDFADPAYARSRTEGEIFWKIGAGRGSMPAYERALDAADRWRLARYVHTLSKESDMQAAASAVPEGRTPREVVASTVEECCGRHPEAAGAFRAAVVLLDERSLGHGNRRFAELGLEERRALIGSLLDPYAKSRVLRTLYHFSDYGRGVRGLWRLVCMPILTGFYASSFGWKVVGYPHRRGVGTNLTDYQVPPRPA